MGSGSIWASAMDVSIWDIGLAGEILVKDPALRSILYTAASARGTPSPSWSVALSRTQRG